MDDKLKAARKRLQEELKRENEAAKRANAEELRRARNRYDMILKKAQATYQAEQAMLKTLLEAEEINKLRRKPRRWGKL